MVVAAGPGNERGSETGGGKWERGEHRVDLWWLRNREKREKDTRRQEREREREKEIPKERRK